MHIFLLDKNKITKLVLPNEIEGAYSLEYRPEDLSVKRTVNIEADGGQWILKSNGEVNATQNGLVVSSIALNEYKYFPVKIRGSENDVGLFCLPAVEKNYYKATVNSDIIKIGNTADSAICYQLEFIQENHATIYKEENKWYISCPEDNDKCIVYLNDIRVIKKELKIGDIIFIFGLKIIWLPGFIYVFNPMNKVTINSLILPNYVEPSIDNSKLLPVSEEESDLELYKIDDYFFHTPRIKDNLEEKEIVIDAPPANQINEELPFILTIGTSLTMMASAFMSGYSILYAINNDTKTTSSLIPSIVMFFALVIGSLIMPRISRAYQRGRAKKKENHRQKKYTAYLDDKVKEIDLAIANQTRILQENNPAIGECYGIVFSNSRSKWSREIKDDDFLVIRLGIGNILAKLKINAPSEQFSLDEDNLKNRVIEISKKEYYLEKVPITFSFLDDKVSAIICDSIFVQDYINSLILQLITFHSAADLKLVFLLNDTDTKWDYAKFTPHTLNDNKSIRFFANNITEVKTVCSFLEEEFNYRKDSLKSTGTDGEKEIVRDDTFKNFNSYYLIITNDYLMVKNIPIIDKILNSSDNLGFSFLICERSLRKLPNQCEVFMQIMEPESVIIRKNTNKQIRFAAEYDGKIDMRSISTHLANIPLLTAGTLASLPTTLTFLDMLRVSKIEQLNINNRWKENNPTISLQAPIGVHTSGDTFVLDLHEKFHGPHGLIAGSTGSGKSEFIITYILSMAINYHPDEVQFVIIDYKGGGLAGAFENRITGLKLPHLVGTITNLDISEMNRTLVSINSELKRRQRLFNETRDALGESTIDIYKYQMYYREGMVKEPIAHLFIISDEFAELKAQQPDFMDELISTARIGRSLGVHLILATQKPSGVVNDQIWSNSKFKVCLKVQGRSDSMEMLKKPDAATIKEVGRFYLQVGYDEFFDIGQSGWAGAKYMPTDRIIKKTDDSINFINNTGYAYKSVNDIVKKETAKEQGEQLTNIVKYIIGVADKENYKSKQLWQNILQKETYISSLKEKYQHMRVPFEINPIIGEYDNPNEQLQDVLKLDITNRGNTIIYGMTGSGKENLLTTIIYSTVTDHHPSEVNFYIIDLGTESLKIFEKMPHVGDVCLLGDNEKILNLLIMIDKEIDRRKDLFVDYNGSYNNYCRNSGNTEPSIIIIINNYEVFTEMYNKISEMIIAFYRDCNKYGIYFIVTSTLSSTIRSRVAELFPNKICLQMPNDTDYRSLLGAPRNLFPLKVFGRGVVALEQGAYEFQSAYVHMPDKINDAIKDTIAAFSQYNYKAKRVPVLPSVVTVDLVINEMKGLSQIPIGFDGNKKTVYSHNFINNKINVITANDLEANIDFFYAIIHEMQTDSNINVKVIDAINIFDQARLKVECYKESFDRALALVFKELSEEATSPKNNIYVFLGIGELKAKLGETGQQIYNYIFANAGAYKKTNFIVADNYNSYKKFQTETWYNSVIDNKTGIWLGEGVGNQFAISFPSLSMEDKQLNLVDIGFVANKGAHVIIKKVVMPKEEPTNE